MDLLHVTFPPLRQPACHDDAEIDAWLRRALRDRYAPIIEEPVPPALLQMVASADSVD